MSVYFTISGAIQLNAKGKYEAFKARAAERGLEVGITLERYHSLKQQFCHYCDIDPLLVAIYCHKLKIKTPFMTIDRKDNSVGYVEGNCVPCCFVCNRTKSNFFNQAEMLEIGKIVKLKWARYKDEVWDIYLQNTEDGVYDL